MSKHQQANFPADDVLVHKTQSSYKVLGQPSSKPEEVRHVHHKGLRRMETRFKLVVISDLWRADPIKLNASFVYSMNAFA